MPLDDVMVDVARSLHRAISVIDACQVALDAIGRHGDAMSSIVLPVRDHLRCVAAAGTWQVFSTFAPGTGVVGRVYASGVAETLTNTTRDADYIPLSPCIEVEFCAPIVDRSGRVIGALNVEFAKPVDTDGWRVTTEEAARLIGYRIEELCGPPTESNSEKLLRHAFAFATADSEPELLARSLHAARDVSGLDTPVIVLMTDDGLEVNVDEAYETALSGEIAALDPGDLLPFLIRAHKYGASYSLGSPETLNATGFETLTSVGVRTLIAVPVGVRRDDTALGGVLLVVDERVCRPSAELVNLLSLLTAQAWVSLERLRTVANLRELAISDPLTGLRHHGSFAERLSQASPGQTAVFAIDIDSFKTINDTYGHQAGDRALVNLSRALSTALRPGDELYRIGGDEFAAVVDVQRADEALTVADRLTSAARLVGQTISVGVAIQRTGESAQDTLRRADSALYTAKRNGRDRVRMAA